MMLDVDFAELRAGFARYLAVRLRCSRWSCSPRSSSALMARGCRRHRARRRAPRRPRRASPTSRRSGELLYTRYLFIFEAAGIVLLVAMVGAIVLTRRKRSDVRPQNVSAQVRRRPQDAVVNMQPGVGQGVEL